LNSYQPSGASPARAVAARGSRENHVASAGRSGAPSPDIELGTFWRAHRAALERLCAFWTRGNGADADDLFSEASLRATEAFRYGRERIVNARAWWSTVIANLGRDRLRARARHRWEGAPQREQAALADATPASERLFVARRELSSALRLLNHIPAAQRAAVMARSEGHDYTEIARRLGTSPANARKLVQLGRNSLRAGMSRAAIPSARRVAPVVVVRRQQRSDDRT
jgi:RNA polymerase sigma factor (sigma-70 family)